MFAKVFAQIFDSSIAEDYNCRRMFMDLLVLSDSDGVVDMTPEAISRRTNVPLDEVSKYLNELCQPDPLSRSKLHEGKRIIPIDSKRGWGWQIVNYSHYREIRDEEARRTYFRDYQRVRRKKEKSKSVKDRNLTTVDDSVPKFSSASASSSASALIEELTKDQTYGGINVSREYGKMVQWCKAHGKHPTRARFVNWLNRVERPLAFEKPVVNAPKAQPVLWNKFIAQRYPTAKERDFWKVSDDVQKEFRTWESGASDSVSDHGSIICQ